jgi:hypothetical protein
MDPLLTVLTGATTTPNDCYFAVWDGYGDSRIPHDLQPKLSLPAREYHVLRGPIGGIRTNYGFSFGPGKPPTSANLWWPADHAWCVATGIDSDGTYVGGSRACIDALLADPRLETMETTLAPFQRVR